MLNHKIGAIVKFHDKTSGEKGRPSLISIPHHTDVLIHNRGTAEIEVRCHIIGPHQPVHTMRRHCLKSNDLN
jgi:hypothetical protein